MQVNVSGHHIEVTSALREYVNSKVSKLRRHISKIGKIQITLSVEKQRQVAEANLHVNGSDFIAKTEHSDMYAAIDSLVDKLDRQLLKHKEKIINRQHTNDRN